MKVTTRFLNTAIQGLDRGNVWIAYTTSSGVQIITKDCCLLRFFKHILRCFGCHMYSHINAKSVLEHLQTCDWTEIDTQQKAQFYSLFAKRIHNKLAVGAFEPQPPEELPRSTNFEEQSIASPPLTRGKENPSFNPLQRVKLSCLTRTNQSPFVDESQDVRFHCCDSAFCITEKLGNGKWLYSDSEILYSPQGELIRTNAQLRALAEACDRANLLNLLDQNQELMARVEMHRAHYI